MSYPDCQYSHVTWIRKDSAVYKALTDGLKAFLATLTSAHQAFKTGSIPART